MKIRITKSNFSENEGIEIGFKAILGVVIEDPSTGIFETYYFHERLQNGNNAVVCEETITAATAPKTLTECLADLKRVIG